jgi:hypothetical protein
MQKALIIGVNYTGSADALKGCIPDSERAKAMVSRYGYRPQDITHMTDHTPVKPTRNNILKAINDLHNSGATRLFFSYAGHGGQIGDRDGDETDGKDEFIAPIDFRSSSVIKDDVLFDMLVKPLKNGQTLTVVTDSCNSGSVLDLRYGLHVETKPHTAVNGRTYQYRQWDTKFTDRIGKRDHSQGKVIHIAGCLDEQLSSESTAGDGKWKGMCSYFLEKSLAPNKNLPLKFLMKDINGMLDINGFRSQNSQISSNKPLNMAEPFNP